MMDPENPDDEEDDEGESSEKMGFSADGEMFFGTTASEKKSLRRTRDRKRIDPTKDLDLNAVPRKGPAKIGETVRLIDLAMGGEDFAPTDQREHGDDPSGADDDASVSDNEDPLAGPESTPLADHSQARPGRAARPFAAKSTGRTFVTSDVARQDPAPRTGTKRMVVLRQDEVGRRALPGRDSAPATSRVPMPGRSGAHRGPTPPPGASGRPLPGPQSGPHSNPNPGNHTGPQSGHHPHPNAGPSSVGPARGLVATGRASQTGLRAVTPPIPPTPGKPMGRPQGPASGPASGPGQHGHPAHGVPGPIGPSAPQGRGQGRAPTPQPQAGSAPGLLPTRGPGAAPAQRRETPPPQSGGAGSGLMPKPGPTLPPGPNPGPNPGSNSGSNPGSNPGSNYGATPPSAGGPARGPKPNHGPGPRARP